MNKSPQMRPVKAGDTAGQVSVISLGCPKNLVDSEVILGLFGAKGYQLTQFPESADIVVINTCSFIKDARTESKRVIRNICTQAKKNAIIIVCGCLPQITGSELLQEFPRINALLGSADFYKLPDIVARLFNSNEKIIEISTPTFIYNSNHPRLVSTARGTTARGATSSMPSYTYLKIAEGCSNHCSYCRIPFIRGKYRSREIADIVDEAHKLANLGIKEIILIAQDITNFGKDKGKYLICSLLKKLEKVEGIRWLRLLYTHPAHFTDELITIIKESKKICKYIDLPIQHTHPEILKLMNRPSPEPTKELIYKLKEQGFTLRTTILVGFPGERDEHFGKLLKDIQEIEFDWLGAFAYSTESDTPASSLPDKVPEKIKQERLKRIMEVQNKITLKKNQSRVGKSVRVLVDTEGMGHTEFQCPEIDGKIICSKKMKSGKFFTGVVKRVTGIYDLAVEPPPVIATLNEVKCRARLSRLPKAFGIRDG